MIANNGVCGVGVAFKSRIGGEYTLIMCSRLVNKQVSGEYTILSIL